MLLRPGRGNAGTHPQGPTCRSRSVADDRAGVCQLADRGRFRGRVARKLTPSAQVTFRLIVVSTERAARELAERLQRGADADAIAAAESIDPSAARGGLIGPVVLAELRPELRDALAPLTPGATSGVIRLPIGFGVVQLAEPRQGRRLRSDRDRRHRRPPARVQPTVSVDGFAEANTILQEAPKARDDWNMHPQHICEARRQSLAEMVASMTELTASMKAAGDSPAPDPVDVIQADVILGQIHAYDGRMAETIARFEQA